MKVKIQEFDTYFSFDFEAETVKDAALLTRFGLNKTKELRRSETYAVEEGVFSGHIAIGKAKNAHCIIRRSK